MFISLSQAKYNITNIVFTLIHSIFPGSECEHTNRLFISVQFRSFLLSGKTGGQLDVTTHIYHKSCAHHPHSECYTFFHGNLSNPKSSEDTLLYLYVIWNMLKSADLLETILTPVICHKDVRSHDGVTLYFSMKFPFNFRGLRIGNKSAATFKKGISVYPSLSA